MKNRVFNTTALIVAMLCVAMSFSACVSKSHPTTDEQVAPDAQIANIEALAEFMTQDLRDNDTPQELQSLYEAQSAAITSYWTLNHKGEDQNQMTEVVFKELKTLAEKLGAGSTVDMMKSAEINSAIAKYVTAQDYCEKYKDNPLYQAEMNDWLQLEDELDDFYGELAELANWGDSITKVTSANALAFLAATRQVDYSQLKKGGQFADDEPMTIAEARADLIQELEDAKSLEDNLVDDENFRETLKDMREHADKIVVQLDKWLESRNKLCQAEGIPESHTAHLIANLGTRIMLMIEG